MVEVDGAYGEGGGQIVRTACALAARTRQACRITNIRQARRAPGLRLQHVLAVRALRDLCRGSVIGDRIGSRELTFHPGAIAARGISVAIDTAASIPLIAQCLLPDLISAPGPLRLTFAGGATDTAFAPPYDYFRGVFLWFLQRIGIHVNVEAGRRGFYPAGGAQVSIKVTPAKPNRLILTERGQLKGIRLLSAASTLLKQRKVAERQVEGALRLLDAAPIAPEAVIEYVPSISPGSALCIIAEFERTVLAATALGARGKMAEQVGWEAAQRFVIELNSSGCLDCHMADQILPYMALAENSGCVTVSEITEHCRTNMWVIERFIDGKFEVQAQSIRWTPPKRNERPATCCV